MPDHTLPYNDYGSAIRRRLGTRIQKLALDAGMGCPNRDGSIGMGGCTFCLNETFSPSYCRETKDMHEQIERAIKFHAARRRTSQSYVAYLQSGSNTYATIDILEEIYGTILSHPQISGLIIGTRPDCIDEQKLELLEHIAHSKYVAVEYGVETLNDATLRHTNRRHTSLATLDAIARTKAHGLDVGAHLIIGLPYEREEHIITSIEGLNSLDINSIKFHQLQIYRNTPMAAEWEQHPERFMFGDSYNTESYVELLTLLIRHLNPQTSVERMASSAPRHLIAHSPLGGIRPDIVRQRVTERLNTLGAHQGDLLYPPLDHKMRCSLKKK